MILKDLIFAGSQLQDPRFKQELRLKLCVEFHRSTLSIQVGFPSLPKNMTVGGLALLNCPKVRLSAWWWTGILWRVFSHHDHCWWEWLNDWLTDRRVSTITGRTEIPSFAWLFRRFGHTKPHNFLNKFSGCYNDRKCIKWSTQSGTAGRLGMSFQRL